MRDRDAKRNEKSTEIRERMFIYGFKLDHTRMRSSLIFFFSGTFERRYNLHAIIILSLSFCVKYVATASSRDYSSRKNAFCDYAASWNEALICLI